MGISSGRDGAPRGFGSASGAGDTLAPEPIRSFSFSIRPGPPPDLRPCQSSLDPAHRCGERNPARMFVSLGQQFSRESGLLVAAFPVLLN
jgi:hypothetical protein